MDGGVTMIDFYATREWYLDHLAPIWHALPADQRGRFGITPRASMFIRTQQLGIDHDRIVHGPPLHGDAPVVCAGGQDIGGLTRTVLVEHGAGQTYRTLDHESWAGGPGRENVCLFIVPNEQVAARNRFAYPDVPNVLAAPHVQYLLSLDWAPEIPVVFGRHWETALLPELQSAWPHHFAAIRDYCTTNRDRVALHFHPRIEDMGRTLASEWRVTYLNTLDDVARRGFVFVTDNSSAAFELAYCGRPIVWLNCPHYRRDVEHGLRFWSHIDVGYQVDDPDRLEPQIAYASGMGPTLFAEELTGDVFPVVKNASSIAAAAIMDVA